MSDSALWAIVAIGWWLDLHLSMQSVSIITIPASVKLYLIQFAGAFRQVGMVYVMEWKGRIDLRVKWLRFLAYLM